MGGVYQELMAAEKKMDGFIDACKREELKEGDVGREIERSGFFFLVWAENKSLFYFLITHTHKLKCYSQSRFLPQMRHLAEIYMSDSDYDVAELQYGDISTLDVDLDSILVCIAFAKQTIAALEQDGRSYLSSYVIIFPISSLPFFPLCFVSFRNRSKCGFI